MAIYTGPRQGEHKPLAIPGEGPGAFIVGLTWNEKAASSPLATLVKGLLGRAAEAAEDDHDLDLYGYVFDDQNRLKAVVSPEENALTDISGAIFHSGDNTTGGGDGEVITVHTRAIPDDYRHFFFLVRSDASLSLADVGDARIHLATADATTRALNNPIVPPAQVVARGYVFCHVARTADGWTCRSLDAYTDFEENWGELLASFSVTPGAPGTAG